MELYRAECGGCGFRSDWTTRAEAQRVVMRHLVRLHPNTAAKIVLEAQDPAALAEAGAAGARGAVNAAKSGRELLRPGLRGDRDGPGCLSWLLALTLLAAASARMLLSS